ncbi:hypothetical protein XNC3_90004 [Xenorhabdus nematophila F1]|nr:hypothetical protein XNC3_90004 [Xenorhabdus nematophila F1]
MRFLSRRELCATFASYDMTVCHLEHLASSAFSNSGIESKKMSGVTCVKA